MSHPPPSPLATVTFFTALQQLPDPRDNRGRRHQLALVVCGVILAMMAGRARLSAIHRFLTHRWEWLCNLTQTTAPRCISRAHLPRLLLRVDWAALTALSLTHFGVAVAAPDAEWVALDGKALRGSRGEQVVLARTHQSGTILAHQPLTGPKAHEVPTVRTVLAQPRLCGRKVTLDAGHCNPQTTAQIHQAHGVYLVQLKANQPTLFAAVQTLTATALPLGTQQRVDKGHGRLEARHATFFSLAPLPLPTRWQASGLCTVVVVARTTTQLATAKSSQALAYYLSNTAAPTPAVQTEITTAIRGHWGCEADHWRRDVTLQEDQVRVKHPIQAQGLGVLRTVVMRVFRSLAAPNYQALIDTLTDSPSYFTKVLRQVGFL